jgi:lipoprotein NlpD
MNGFSRPLAILGIALLLASCRTVVVQPPLSNVPPTNRSSMPMHGPGGTYQVSKGDTLYSIAFRNGMDFRELAKSNGIVPPYTIWPGQVLTLSTVAAAPAHVVVPAVVSQTPPTPHPAISKPPPGPVFETVNGAPPASAGNAAPAQPVVVAPKPAAGVATASSVVPVAGVPAPPPTAIAPTAVVVASGASRSAAGVNWRWPASGAMLAGFQPSAAIPGIELGGKAGDPVVAAADGVVVYSGNGLVGYGELVIIKHNDSLLSAYGHNRKRLVTEGQRVKAGQQIAEMGSSGSSRDELEFQIRKDGNPVNPLDYLPSR